MQRPHRLLGIFALVVLANATSICEKSAARFRFPFAGFFAIRRAAGPVVLHRLPRICDPKLTNGSVELRFAVTTVRRIGVTVEILQGMSAIRQFGPLRVNRFDGLQSVNWDGKDAQGRFVDVGTYTVRVRDAANAQSVQQATIDVVRLGITEIAAVNETSVESEWQMVYFMKGNAQEFFATPAIHEYLNKKGATEISDLDLDNGHPRSIPAVHTATDSPKLENGLYDENDYNYPVCYKMGARAKFEVTFGDAGTSAKTQTVMAAGYPVTGYEIRARLFERSNLLSSSNAIAAGNTVTMLGPTMPAEVARIDKQLIWRWQYRPTGSALWHDIPGALTIPMRFYTVLDKPLFKAGAVGTQYAGPWVEVAEYWYQWHLATGVAVDSASDAVVNHVRGFFGQVDGLPAAIEGMKYDGAAAYLFGHPGPTGDMHLSALLNRHANGDEFNCTDNMGATSTMLSMMGVQNVKGIRHGPMKLHVIWPIGLAYNNSRNFFVFHRTVTLDDGTHIVDTCLQVDADGQPALLPGVPGWNTGRSFAGLSGYDALLSPDPVTRQLEELPGLK